MPEFDSEVVGFVQGWLGYLAVALLLTWLSVRLTAGLATWVQILIRSGVTAILLSPTFFACGASAPIPFIMLVFGDIFWSDSLCFRHFYQTSWNVVHIVLPAWCLYLVLFAAWDLTKYLLVRIAHNKN